ncbi:hypothetical protein NE237_002512 [Protea cynaroides]|uniref:Uncharacterized protein n=1 Tax=Protea cynaroides TaxID=273540 RepID=A0A9Q0KW81_9MAGN|nr:hypothetical protein NE237_002512 [Protea cynaroides]
MDKESQHHDDHQHQPLVGDDSTLDTDRANFIQEAIKITFRSTADLVNLLPTGTVLVFQLLSPIFSNQGQCDAASKYLTAGLVIFCGLSCFLSSFTVSFRDDKGTVHYGIATCHGLWIIDGSITVPTEQDPDFQLKSIDFLHAFMSTLVFASVALFSQNVRNDSGIVPSVTKPIDEQSMTTLKGED